MEKKKRKKQNNTRRVWAERTLTAIKTAESILLITGSGDTTRQQQEIKRKTQRKREKDRLREEKERRRRQHHWFCQTMMKYYKIFYSQYSQRTQVQHKLVSEILSKMPCAFNCGGLDSDFVLL